jgi:hypothetical protein
MQRNNRLYLVGSGRLFLFIILKDKNDESEKINDQRAEGKKHFDGYVHPITSPSYETSGKVK